MDIKTLIKDALDFSFYGEGLPIPYTYMAGEVPLLVVVGQNASGKSLFRRTLNIASKDAGMEYIQISMQGRGESMGGARSFVYGDEGADSTGKNSASTVVTGIRTCQARTSPHVIFWDEPDVGLSDEYAMGMGLSIAQFVRNPASHTVMVCLVTHRKELLESLTPLKPHYLCLGPDQYPTLDDYLCRKIHPRSLEDLIVRSNETFQAIHREIQKKKNG